MNKTNGAAKASNGAAPDNLPRHVAIIMDGNGRWAKSRFLPRVEGHRAGAKAVRSVVSESRKLGIKYLTLFAFSTENWYRPGDEVSALMKLFLQYLQSEVTELVENDIRLHVIGDKERLPTAVQNSIDKACERTQNGKSLNLVLAISYGARDEIVKACKAIAQECCQGGLTPEKIDEATIQRSLFTADIPDPDLLIRTSGESRISNFLLWQLAYSEIVVSPILWPDFDAKEYHRCLYEFSQRTRRFGLTENQTASTHE